MDAFHRLLRFGRAANEHALPVWRVVVSRSEPALQWLKLQFGHALQWLKGRPRAVFWAGGIGIALAFLVFSGATAAGAALLGWAALRQAATASERHQEQTNADRQRRITESFSKAIEQLGSDKLEVRLGGIYSLERISKESPDDYWTVMENLTAFVRERSRRNEAERTSQDLEQRVSRRAYFLWEGAGRPNGQADGFWTAAAKAEDLGEPVADIAAVLTVIKRRTEQSREREGANDWHLDFNNAILKLHNLVGAHLEGAFLLNAHLEGAILGEAHLERASLAGARLEGAYLIGANLEGARVRGAHFEGGFLMGAHFNWADLSGAHLRRAFLMRAHLNGANLKGAHLEGADLSGAHLEWADFKDATGLSEAQLREAHGDTTTKLPEGMARPAHWPGAEVATPAPEA
jgi:uncharacterized protein YjbI with pentapeptide repeats